MLLFSDGKYTTSVVANCGIIGFIRDYTARQLLSPLFMDSSLSCLGVWLALFVIIVFINIEKVLGSLKKCETWS